jgi:hypothetical protein
MIMLSIKSNTFIIVKITCRYEPNYKLDMFSKILVSRFKKRENDINNKYFMPFLLYKDDTIY